MKAPNNKAGMLTEQIMLQVKAKLPNINTHEYNKIWEAVLSVLTIELPESGDVVKYPHGGGMFIHRAKP